MTTDNEHVKVLQQVEQLRRDADWLNEESKFLGAYAGSMLNIAKRIRLAAEALASQPARSPIQAGEDAPEDSTNLEVVEHFLRVARTMKPVGQWPGERVCVAIERLINGPRNFISEADRAPYRGHNGRGGDENQSLPPYKGNATPQPAQPSEQDVVQKGCGDPTCGCDVPFATEPMQALRFLSGRFKYAGVGENVARSYARDIDAILAATPPHHALDSLDPPHPLAGQREDAEQRKHSPLRPNDACTFPHCGCALTGDFCK